MGCARNFTNSCRIAMFAGSSGGRTWCTNLSESARLCRCPGGVTGFAVIPGPQFAPRMNSENHLVRSVCQLALWHFGTLALWHSGLLAFWHSGLLAVWPSGHLALWPSGRLAIWPSGRLAVWPSGRLAMALVPLCRPRDIFYNGSRFVAGLLASLDAES